VAGDALIVQARRQGSVVLGFVPAPRLSSGPVLAALAPAAAVDGARDLFIGVSRPVEPMLQGVRAPGGGGSFVALLNGEGELLAGDRIAAGGAAANAVRARFADAPSNSLRSAFKVGDDWAVAMPLEDHGDLYVVEGWTPAPRGLPDLLRAAWVLLVPVLLWLAAVGATWLAIEHFVARPLLVVEGLARAYARGEDSQADEALLRGAPNEIASLRRTLAAMAKTLRGRENRLTVALQEERALLLELNHRVKNNLQMVASILSIQARGTSDAAEARGLARAQDRVQLLALAHAQIYGSGEVRDIALDQLAGEIIRSLCAARGAVASRVRLDLALQPVRAKADLAVPLAFLIGESVSCLLDLNGRDMCVEGLSISLAPVGARGFVLDIDAKTTGTTFAAPHATSERLIGAFAKQIGAQMTHDPLRPYHVRIEGVVGAGEDEEEEANAPA
jgi:hypothetical protein